MCEHDGNPDTPCDMTSIDEIINKIMPQAATEKMGDAELTEELTEGMLADPKVKAIMETVGFKPADAGEHHTAEFLARLLAFATEGQLSVATTIMMGGGAGTEVAKYAFGMKQMEAIAEKNQARRLQAVFDAS